MKFCGNIFSLVLYMENLFWAFSVLQTNELYISKYNNIFLSHSLILRPCAPQRWCWKNKIGKTSTVPLWLHLLFAKQVRATYLLHHYHWMKAHVQYILYLYFSDSYKYCYGLFYGRCLCVEQPLQTLVPRYKNQLCQVHINPLDFSHATCNHMYIPRKGSCQTPLWCLMSWSLIATYLND